MDEKELTYNRIIYYEIKRGNELIYTLDHETFYQTKDKIRFIIKNSIIK